MAPTIAQKQLFGPAGQTHAPAEAWDASRFKQVDDSVRGGESSSQTSIVKGKDAGELFFSGFLDTLKLGGAGFASQQYTAAPPFPITIHKSDYAGLQVLVRPPEHPVPSTPLPNGTYSGGGRGPVTSYVFNLYPNYPVKRPDGRSESSLVYEHAFNVSTPDHVLPSHVGGKLAEKHNLYAFDLRWQDFKPMYRGRPADTEGPIDPAGVKLWSLMARSDFGAQSGPFELQVNSLWLLPAGGPEGSQKLLQARGAPSSWDRALRPVSMDGSAGFALYLFATLAFIVWVLWALTPDRCLRYIGIDWYPNREWAFILPSFTLLLVLFAYIVYLAINLRMTPPLHDLRTITDSHASLPPIRPASSMTFDEAVEYYRSGHPLRERTDPDGERRGVDGEEDEGMEARMRREMWDLPSFRPRESRSNQR